MSDTTSTSELADLPGPSSALSPPLCALCNAQPAKYTCPRCRTRSCSLPCSRAHKAMSGCSGERDRTAFVPMNAYGYSTLVNDYVFLEEVGRKVETWGREIVRGGIAPRGQVSADVRGSSMRGGRGRGRGKGRMFGHGQDKRSYLAMQLGIRDIDMDILPPGMERAKRNQSFWDSKKKTAFLSIEFAFQPPPDPVTRRRTGPISLVTNKNNWEQTIQQLIRAGVKNTQRTKKDSVLLEWLHFDDEEEEDDCAPSSVLCVMKRPKMLDDSPTLTYTERPSYYKLDWNSKLSSALRQKHFVEFPTISLVDESLFEGVLIDDSGAAEDMRERRFKRRKLDPAIAKKTITRLVGAYGSDDDDEEANVLNTLGFYSESEGNSDADLGHDIDEEDADVLGDMEEPTKDFRRILDASVGERAVFIEEDEQDLNWGDDELAEDEAKLAGLSAAVHRQFPS
ncbi:hypothetical protein EW145_g1585 [Phellinidium pouzarii]|uniref:Box C/D snoRNA protein 1 n=1 Tax=Phellinidium pouzarii TaxID=167371 RepID=A0A4S4LJJ3_9AGAM|nr:hypothetical protein EW145_g1585 [Phellinidium pouzarii]